MEGAFDLLAPETAGVRLEGELVRALTSRHDKGVSGPGARLTF